MSRAVEAFLTAATIESYVANLSPEQKLFLADWRRRLETLMRTISGDYSVKVGMTQPGAKQWCYIPALNEARFDPQEVLERHGKQETVLGAWRMKRVIEGLRVFLNLSHQQPFLN